MTSAFSWQKSVTLCPASFYTPRPNLPLTSGISTSFFCIPVSQDEKDIFFWCQVQKILQVLIKPFNFSFFSISGQGIDLDYSDIEWFPSETNRETEVILSFLRLHPSTEFRTLVDYEGYSISSNRFLPTVVDIIVI